MQENTAQKQPAPQETKPLDRLSVLLAEDMTAVNALILKNMHSDVPLIPQLAQYLIAAGGKRIRPLMTLAVASLLKADMSRAHTLAAAVEFIHTATLLHDDVVDESEERRGQKAANLIFGNQASVLVGDFLFSKAFQMMVEAKSLEVLKILSDASAVIAQGEVLQLTTANDIGTGFDRYIKVIESKTAALFAASCEVGPVLADSSLALRKDLRDYGMNIGIAFQIIDDTLDYVADQKKLGKTVGDDFREGKVTAPIIFAIESATQEEKSFWQRTVGERNQNEKDFETALSLIHKYNGIEKSHNLAKDYAMQAKRNLSSAPDHAIKSMLMDLADYTVQREL